MICLSADRKLDFVHPYHVVGSLYGVVRLPTTAQAPVDFFP